MRIGIIGTGNMGSTLGGLWAAKRQHQVLFGSRKRAKSDALSAIHPGALGGIYEEACEFGEVVVIATPWHATLGHLERLAPYLDGKFVIDVTNPLTTNMDGMAVEPHTSGGQEVQHALPGAQVVKAFNGIPYKVLDNPSFDGHTAEVYYATDHPNAGDAVRTLIADLRFSPVAVGPLENARYLEGTVYLWLYQVMNGAADPASTVFNIIRR